ncbi:MAG: hypothetical protein EAZ91_25435 [Cytophagales bacterium]|nr:MAG: hypothetical protein EAZ91_25435 [Cytophagales bacterium]
MAHRLRSIFLLLGIVSAYLGLPACAQPMSTTACPTVTYLTNYQPQATRVTLQWFDGAYALPHELQWRAQGSTDWTTLTDLFGNSYLLFDLTANTTYEWRVRVRCGPNQVGDWSVTQTVQTRCGLPTALTATSRSSSRTVLSWQPGLNATRHELEWRRVGDPTWSRVSSTESFYPSITLDDLSEQATYAWRVRSVCDELARSEAVDGPAFAPSCQTPQQLTNDIVRSDLVRVSWTSYEINARFDLRYRPVNGVTWTEVNDLNNTQYTFPMLQQGTNHEWQVRQRCPNGSSTAYVAGSNLAVQCMPPGGIRGERPTPTSIRIAWGGLEGFGGTYELEWWEQGASSRTTVRGLTGTSYLLQNLNPNTVYLARVWAMCVPGAVGQPTNEFTFTTECAVPGITYVPVGTNWAGVHWNNTDLTTPYDLQWRAQGITDWNTVANLTNGVHTLEDLTAGQSYEIRVRRRCSPGIYTDYSAIRTVTPGCYVPTTANAQPNATAAELQWSEGGTGLYELQWRPASGGSYSTVTGLTTGRYSLSNLQPNTAYEFRVGAVCAPNPSPTAFITRTFSTTCPAPQSLNANVASLLGTISLYWGSVPNATYRVERRTVGEPDWNTVSTVALPPASFPGIDLNKSYQFRVTALCANAGESAPVMTSPVSVSCPVPPFSSVVRQTVTSAWIKPASGFTFNTNVTAFELRWRSTFGEPGPWQSLSTTTDGTFMVHDLTANLPYEYQVRTVCGVFGLSNYSASLSFNNRCLPPVVPNQYPGSIVGGRVELAWSRGGTNGLFEIQYRPRGELPWATVTTTQPTPYTLTGLGIAQAYEWRVRGLCTDGQWSGYTNPVTINPAENQFFMRSADPNNSDLVSQTAVRLSWVGRGVVSGYEVRLRLARTTDWGTPTPTTSQSVVVSGLLPNTTYNWQVRWVDGATGERGPWSWVAGFDTRCPDFQTISLGYPIGPNSLTLTLTELPGLTEPVAATFRYRSGTSDWQTISLTSLTSVITGLLPITTYEYQLYRVCADNTPPTDWGGPTFTTGGCGSGIEVSVPNPTTARFAPTTASSVPVSIQVRPLGSTTWPAPIAVNTTSYELTGLQPGTVYEWRVLTTCNPPGTTNFASTGQFLTKCRAAPQPTITPRNGTSATINWPADGGSMTLQWQVFGQTTWQSVPGVISPYVLTGLQPGQAYYFRLRTECTDGLTDTGFGQVTYYFSNCPTGAYSVTAPPAPNITYPLATSLTSNSAQIVWLGGLPDVSFTLRWRPFGQTAWNQTPITTTPYGLTGLTGNTTYEWQMTGNCGVETATVSPTNFTTLPDRSGFYTVLPGDWTDASIWSAATLPGPTNRVQVRHSVTVPPYRPAQTQRIQLENGGSLRFRGMGRLQVGEL